jgi:hypothetical protein
MLINKLRDYYGFPDNEQAQYINKKTFGMNEQEQDEIAEKIIESRSKRFGFPDIATLAKFLTGIPAKKSKGFYWSVCRDCKSEYDYRFIHCPACFLKGKRNTGYFLKTSDNPPPKNVIRWNQTTLEDDGKSTYCVSCPTRDKGFCVKFGDPNYQCSSQEFEYCECKKCCALHKKANAGMKR